MTVQLPQLVDSRTCTACELHQGAQSPGIPTIHYENSLPPGPSTPWVLFVGQNPGSHENQSGVPFSGESGTLLRKVLIDPTPLPHIASIYLTNIARCWSGPVTFKKNWAQVCSGHTVCDIDTLDHSARGTVAAIVALGNPAIHTLSNAFYKKPYSLKTISSINGTSLPYLHNIAFFGSINPVIVLDKRSAITDLIDTITLVHDHLTGNLLKPTRPNIHPVVSPLRNL